MDQTPVNERWDEVEDNPLVIVDSLRKAWNEDVSDFIEDEDFDYLLNVTIKLISGDTPADPEKIAHLLVRLQAISLKFRTQYTAYMGWQKGTTDANMKKNLYRHTYEGIDKLVDTLKWLIKN